MELSESDLERPSAEPAMPEQSLPVLTPPPRRRRRSLLPWVTLLFFVGLGAKLWIDARHSSSAVTSATPSATATQSAPRASATATAITTATATATPTPIPTATATPIPTAAQSPTPAPKPPTASSALVPRVQSAPARLGPGNVHHVGPSKRRKSR